MRASKAIACAGGAVLVLGVVAWMKVRPAVDSPAAASPGGELTVSPADPPGSSEGVGHGRHQARKSPGAVQPAGRPDPRAGTFLAGITPGDPAGVMAHFAELRRKRAAMLVETMAGEDEDVEWSHDLKKRMGDLPKILPQLDELQAVDTDCRQSVCAVHLEFDSAAAYQRVAPLMNMLRVALNSDTFLYRDGSMNETVLYLSRPDATLPDASEPEARVPQPGEQEGS